MNEQAVMFNVLLNSPIANLESLCLTNQQAVNICNDRYFWEQKFAHDNLSIFLTILPNTALEWIAEYYLSAAAKESVRMILLVNNVEQNREDNKTDGIIYCEFLYTILEEFIWLNLPEQLTRNIMETINNENYNPIIKVKIIIIIEPLGNNYKITVKLDISKQRLTANAIVSRSVMMSILTKVSYSHNKTYNAYIYILVNGQKLDFLNITYEYIQEFYSGYPQIHELALQRLGIIDTINVLNI